MDFTGNPNTAAAHAGPLTVGATAATLVSLVTLHANTRFVVMKVEAAPVRLTVTGTTPTATLGLRYQPESQFRLTRAEADLCQLIRAGDTDGSIQVAQYRN